MEGIEEFALPEHGEGTRHNKTQTAGPGIKEKIFYSAGGMGAGLVWITTASFLPIYCTDVAGISAGTVGLIMLISRLIGSLTDLYMGFVVGRTQTRWGKARPWILWSALPMAVSLILLFHIPEAGGFEKGLYLLIIYVLMEGVCFTAFGLPYNTMLSLVSADSYDRNVMNTIRFELILIIQLGVSVITMPLIHRLGGGQEAWTYVTGSYAILCIFMMLICFGGTKERYNAGIYLKGTSSAKQGSSFSELKSLCANKYSRLLTIVTVVIYASLGMSSGARIYYAKYVLGDEDLNSVMVMFGLIPVILTLFFIPRLSRGIGKIKVLFAGGVLHGIGLIIITAAPQNLPVIYTGLVLQGFGLAGLYSCLFAVSGDVADYCRWKDGISEEALVYSMTGFGQKTGTGIGLAMLGISLWLGRYNSATAANSALALFSIKTLYLYLPLALTMIVLFLWYMFIDFDKIYPSMQRELDAVRALTQKADHVEKREIM